LGPLSTESPCISRLQMHSSSPWFQP